MEKDFGETWVTYGIIMRVPFRNINVIQQFLKDKATFVYDKASIGKLIIKEQAPSGSTEGVDVEH